VEQKYYNVTLTQPNHISRMNVSVADLRPSSGRTSEPVSKLSQTWQGKVGSQLHVVSLRVDVPIQCVACGSTVA